jgi:hypothetical protein
MKGLLVEKISDRIHGVPLFLQFSKDDQWEKCWIVDCSGKRPSESKLREYLEKKEFDNLAIEFVFKDKDGFNLIFTFGYSDKQIVGSELNFLKKIVDYTWSFSSFVQLIDLLNKEIIGVDGFLFRVEPDLIRIGVVNHWFSVGPILLWEKGEKKKMNATQLERKLKSNSKVVSTDLNWQGLAFIYKKNEIDQYYVIKFQCGIKDSGYYVLSTEKILKLLQGFGNFSE